MRKRGLTIITCLILSIVAYAQGGKHFISDNDYRTKTEKAFNEKMQLIGKQFFNTKGLNAGKEEIEAVKKNTETVREIDAKISSILEQTTKIKNGLDGMCISCMTQATSQD